MASEAATPQPLPCAGRQDVEELVITDLHARIAYGVQKYGTRLQTFNGRDALVDAYQEALDLVLYLRQAIAEREETNEDKGNATATAIGVSTEAT